MHNFGDSMIYILYSSQYNVNIPPEKLKANNEHLSNLILKNDKYKAQIEKQKNVIKKPSKQNKPVEI